jgi:hypothetical protein
MRVPADVVRKRLIKAGFHRLREYEGREVWFRLGLPPPNQVNFPIRNGTVREEHAKAIQERLEDAGLLPPEEGP